MTSAPTTAPIRFEDIRTGPPDLEALGSRTRELRTALEGASSVQEGMPVLREWDALRREVGTWEAMVELRFEQDTTDAARKQAREAWDAAAPRWTEQQVSVMRSMLDHPRRADFERELGHQLFALWESEVLAFDSAIMDDLARESALEAEYTELLASASFDYQGEQLTLATLPRWREHADREVRHGAERVLWQWFSANAPQFDRIYDDQVKLRARMAAKLGLTDFVDLGYKRMCRVDYGRTDVERFRAEIVREVVPLAVELHRRQAETLGVDRLMAWDERVHDPRGNPRPAGDGPWLVARAQEMFDSLGGGLDEFFRRMQSGGFLDLEPRKGKSGGGFCTSFPTCGMPFVFGNFNGTMGDVQVLTHEIGHAFQGYSSRGLFPSDYHWPTTESCEIHSMSLEFLTWPQMDLFFGADGERYRRTHLTDALLFLPYGTAVDHFQHLVYERPDATPAERHAMWLEMEHTYLPWRDWGDLEYAAKGGRWQNQRHIYLQPFYYIDYILAQTCALQFWVRAQDDRAGALEAYVALCKRGGSAPFQELVRSAGLTSPFDQGCLTGVVARARETLGV